MAVDFSDGARFDGGVLPAAALPLAVVSVMLYRLLMAPQYVGRGSCESRVIFMGPL